MTNTSNRLQFLRKATSAIGGMALFAGLPKSLLANATIENTKRVANQVPCPPRIRFAVIGINHAHIHSLVDTVTKGGGLFVSFYASEAVLSADFQKIYPQAKAAKDQKEILEDPSIQLIVSAAIPSDRAAIGIAAMQHGKHFLVDKPAVATLEQLADVRRVQKATGKIFAVLFGRFENPGTLRAGELVKAGGIGKVVQTMALAPHRVNPKTRPSWFWDTKYYGGIINDIGSHQFDDYLFFTGSSEVQIVASQVANIGHPQYPAFEDFGDVMLTGSRGTGYMRLDWFTPDGLANWGDDRITILGTEGYIELRKNLDIAGRKGGHHLFLVDQKETRYFDCSDHALPFGEQFVDDMVNGTATSMNQEQCFLATELALKAQKQSRKVKF